MVKKNQNKTKINKIYKIKTFFLVFEVKITKNYNKIYI